MSDDELASQQWTSSPQGDIPVDGRLTPEVTPAGARGVNEPEQDQIQQDDAEQNDPGHDGTDLAMEDLAGADFDPDGTDLARAMARQVAGMMPAARGVRKTPKKSRVVDPDVRSGPGPDERDPQRLDAVLGRLVADRGWQAQVSARTLLDRWAELVGDLNARHSTVEGFADGCVTVRADSTAWATSLRALAPQLVAELNHRLGEGTVTRVQVLGPAAPSWKHGPRSVRDGRGPRDTYG